MASIRERVRKDGSTTWAVLWRDMDTGTQTSRTFDDRREAQMLKDFLDANNNSFRLAVRVASELRSQSPAVRDVLTGHIERLTGVESGTRSKYRRMAIKHIIPALGARPVDRLTRADVASWFNALEVAPKTRKNIHALLSAALETAVGDHLISENPAKGIRGPKSAPRRPAVFLTRPEVDVIAETIDPRWSGFIHLLAASGLRYAEATALRPSDIRFKDERAMISVHRAWKRTDDGEKLGTPKSPRSHREVTVSRTATARLQNDLKGVSRQELVYTRPGGAHLRNGWFHENVWGPTMVELDGQGVLLARPVLHDLRHTHASWLLAAGVPIHVVSARLGHESITTTVNTYGHLVNEADRLAADALD
ncbi:site-specific integrase [Kocuria dechangensis]|uniref:Site-specific integrase n=1 Tax=Kocuria dechangensis TaxID=1176249 RepID=A0A917H0A8_9MICC|nr:site-specific integrase [Kocuria dechangensis]GGG62737.1 site-specific integrase [Kocuria dechangensis]